MKETHYLDIEAIPASQRNRILHAAFSIGSLLVNDEIQIHITEEKKPDVLEFLAALEGAFDTCAIPFVDGGRHV
jgi:hypothetical protein